MVFVDLAQITPILKRSGCYDEVMATIWGLPLSRRATDVRTPVAPRIPSDIPAKPSPRPQTRTSGSRPNLRVPRVQYVAVTPASARKINALPAHDLAVYKQIARRKGTTRAQLLTALGAETRTGVVDGAVRRLRLKHVISVAPVKD
jgi:membrane-bound lytic murein transglycosylase B